MTTFQITPPGKFNFCQPDDWPKWIRRFERFRQASDLDKEDEQKQISTLVYAMGDEAEDILISFNLSEEDRVKYDVVRDRFDKHFIVKRNVIYERARFHSRKQGPDESIDSFITSLFTLIEHCGYGNLHDEMIRDRIVIGLYDEGLKEKLQLDPELTLEKAMNTARLKASVRKQQTHMQNNFTESNAANNVDAVHQKNRGAIPKQRSYQPGQNFGHQKQRNNEQRKTSKYCPKRKLKCCSRCGKPPHPKKDCPAKDALCNRCNRYGHYATMCYSSTLNNVETIGKQSWEDSDDYDFLGAIFTPQNTSRPWTVTLSVCNTDVSFKIDTGADVTVISEDTLFNMKEKPKLVVSDKKLFGPGQSDLKVIGKFNTVLQSEDNESKESVYVVKYLGQSLLGRPAIENLNILTRINEINSKEKYKEKFPTLFHGLGKIPGEHTIRLKPNAIPHAVSTPRRIPLPLFPAVKEELERMEKLGIISKIDTPTDWCAGLVVVPKPSGKVRLCVDLTKLNENVLRELYPLPTVDETLAQLSGAKFFSKLDANSGFWQIPLSPESSPLTTFITPFGRFHFNRLPFGISSAPEVYQKKLSAILRGLPGVLSQMDDVIIFGRTQEEHDSRLLATLEKLKNNGVTLNEKCEFSKQKLSFLGHVIDSKGIRPDPKKVDSIMDMPPPHNVSSLRSFLGMANQLGKFSPNLSEKTKPLRDLLNKDAVWVWGHQQEEAFQAIKHELCQAPVLALYDPTKDTRISSDASSYGLGAVIGNWTINSKTKSGTRPLCHTIW